MNTLKKRVISSALVMTLFVTTASGFMPENKTTVSAAKAAETVCTNTIKTENSTIYNLGNGKHKAVMYPTDVRFKNIDGGRGRYERDRRCGGAKKGIVNA